MVFISIVLGFVIAFIYNPKTELLIYKIEHENNYKTLSLTICLVIFTIVLFVGFFWLFYRLIYGTLLRKLNANYKELKKIDL